ncbi:rhodanese-like domain-containing protein [bacterium]|nr:MAG: rhodanese-like domain-containing protein [bacterium]
MTDESPPVITGTLTKVTVYLRTPVFILSVPMPKAATVHSLKSALTADPKTQVLDVRERAEFDADGGAPGSLLAPLSTDVAAGGLFDAQKPVFVMCRSGARAQKAALLLEARGFVDVRVVEGGMEAWKAAGFPVAGQVAGAWSIERQVRFTVGVLLVSSFVLGRAVHPVFYALAPLLGAGLLYSSLTDTCGMGAVLLKMPWNRR